MSETMRAPIAPIGWSIALVYMLITAVPKAGSFLPDVAANLFGTRP